MSLFAICLVADEWQDIRHAWQDLQIEAVAEVEVEDFEWDEDGLDNGDGQIKGFVDIKANTYAMQINIIRQAFNSCSLLSHKQQIGLVRHYAPRKSSIGVNYILI